MLDPSPANSGNWSGGRKSLVSAKAPASFSGLSATAWPPNVAAAPSSGLPVPVMPVGFENSVRA